MPSAPSGPPRSPGLLCHQLGHPRRSPSPAPGTTLLSPPPRLLNPHLLNPCPEASGTQGGDSARGRPSLPLHLKSPELRCPRPSAPHTPQGVALAFTLYPPEGRQVALPPLPLSYHPPSSSFLPHDNTLSLVPHRLDTCSLTLSTNPQLTHLVAWRSFLRIIAILSSALPVIILGDSNVHEITSFIPLSLFLVFTPKCCPRTCHYEKQQCLHSLGGSSPLLRQPSLFSLVHFLAHQLQPLLVSPSMLTPFHGSLAPWCPHSLHPLNIHDPSLGSLPWNVRSSCYPFTCFRPVSPRSVLRPHTCAFQAHVTVEEHNCAVSPCTSILTPHNGPFVGSAMYHCPSGLLLPHISG